MGVNKAGALIIKTFAMRRDCFGILTHNLQQVRYFTNIGLVMKVRTWSDSYYNCPTGGLDDEYKSQARYYSQATHP